MTKKSSIKKQPIKVVNYPDAFSMWAAALDHTRNRMANHRELIFDTDGRIAAHDYAYDEIGMTDFTVNTHGVIRTELYPEMLLAQDLCNDLRHRASDDVDKDFYCTDELFIMSAWGLKEEGMEMLCYLVEPGLVFKAPICKTSLVRAGNLNIHKHELLMPDYFRPLYLEFTQRKDGGPAPFHWYQFQNVNSRGESNWLPFDEEQGAKYIDGADKILADPFEAFNKESNADMKAFLLDMIGMEKFLDPKKFPLMDSYDRKDSAGNYVYPPDLYPKFWESEYQLYDMMKLSSFTKGERLNNGQTITSYPHLYMRNGTQDQLRHLEPVKLQAKTILEALEFRYTMEINGKEVSINPSKILTIK
jgi:hypothetical protein